MQLLHLPLVDPLQYEVTVVPRKDGGSGKLVSTVISPCVTETKSKEEAVMRKKPQYGYRQRRVESPQRREAKQRPPSDAPQLLHLEVPPIGEISTIAGGFISGGATSPSRKTHTKEN